MFSSKFIINASVIHNKLDHLISRVNYFSGTGMINISSNAGEMSANGVELGIKSSPVDKFNINLNLSYQDSKDDRKGWEDIKLAYSPKIIGICKRRL